jgi:hypothetical protein
LAVFVLTGILITSGCRHPSFEKGHPDEIPFGIDLHHNEKDNTMELEISNDSDVGVLLYVPQMGVSYSILYLDDQDNHQIISGGGTDVHFDGRLVYFANLRHSILISTNVPKAHLREVSVHVEYLTFPDLDGISSADCLMSRRSTATVKLIPW